MPVLMPDFRTVRNDDFEEFYKETKNPIFVWFIVWHNIKMKKCIPEFALNYLEEVSRKILDSDKNCSEKDFYRFIFNQLGFRNRKDLQYIDNWSREERIFGLLDSYMKNNNVSQNAALDALKLTAQGSQDFNLIRKKKAFQKAKKGVVSYTKSQTVKLKKVSLLNCYALKKHLQHLCFLPSMSHMEKGIIFVVNVLKDFLLAASLLKASDGINSKKF